jgi:ABC-type multidrug transport system permease subunit
MTTQHLCRLHTLQILGVVVGIIVPLMACVTLFWAATTGSMPFFATGALPFVLLTVAALLGCWVWTETAEIR